MGRDSVELEADVCVVGAGIVGLAHAHEARRRGLRVVVLERSERAVGASVRNFGHGCLAAMADGVAVECALDARERWLELGALAADELGAGALEVVTAGTVVVARSDDELAVLSEVAADPRRGATMIDPAEVGALAPVALDGVLGGMHATLDYRVDPRRAVAALAALLERDPQATIVWGAPVHEVDTGVVRGAAVTVRAGLVLLCPGPAFETLPAAVRPQRDGLELCKLQMLRVAAPAGRVYGPALMTGLSLLRYPAFTATAGAAAVRGRIERERSELVAAGIHLIVTQLPDGDLLLGDSHDYGATVSPFASERVFELILGEAARLLLGPGHGARDAAALRVRERWQGIYPTAPGDPFLVQEPLPGVHVVEVVSGIGMTTSLGLATRVLDRALTPA